MATAKTTNLREGVRRAYSQAAERPGDEHPFPVGREFAESVGYPPALLESLPAVSVDVFAGVSNVAWFADIPPAATVLDLGCGGGLDSIVAAQRTGLRGKVIAIDFSESMLARARRGASEAGIHNIKFDLGAAERLPVDDCSVDVALINGILNLSPTRSDIFRELARVVKPGGAVYAAELILRETLPPNVQADETNWFA